MRAREIGEILGLDFSYHITPDGTRLLALTLIDEASKFHVAKIVRSARVKAHSDLGNCDAVDLIDCLQEYTRYLPSPKVIHCDDEGVSQATNSKNGAIRDQSISDRALEKHTGRMEMLNDIMAP